MTKLQQQSINALKMLSVDMVEEVNSGHPGLPMGCAALVYNLYQNHLRFNPKKPNWINRDRFVLSAGHGSALLYSTLYAFGYKISLKDLKQFRQLDSITPGHPEFGLTPGVEATTGPLGQGFANGIGMALAARIFSDRYNKPGFKIFDYTTYALVSDGDMMEGISAEAASFAANLNLGKLIYFYDCNQISIEGDTKLTFSEDVRQRFESYNWQVQIVRDGNNLAEIDKAITRAKKTKKPSLIITKTIIGDGSPNMAGTAQVHGAPLGTEEVKTIKKNLGLPNKKFYVPRAVGNHFRKKALAGKKLEERWNKMFTRYKKKYPELAKELLNNQKNILPKDWNKDLTSLFKGKKEISTRAASGEVLNVLAKNIPNLVGGSADLAPSTKTYLNDMAELSCFSRSKNIRNIHFGVREHAMGAILNGLAYGGGIISFGGTFLVFSDYMRASIRVASLSGLNVKYVFTHDSIAVGEDGPTHQPIEQLMSLRLISDLTVIRPADAGETKEAWKYGIKNKKPIALILSRQNLPQLDQKIYTPAKNLIKGAYILYETNKKPDAIIIATGSEVHLALKIAHKLESKKKSIKVISMPSWELFDNQSAKYKESIIPSSIKKIISIEAGATTGWQKYTGSSGLNIGIDQFGASGKGEEVMSQFGFSEVKIFNKVFRYLNN